MERLFEEDFLRLNRDYSRSIYCIAKDVKQEKVSAIFPSVIMHQLVLMLL